MLDFLKKLFGCSCAKKEEIIETTEELVKEEVAVKEEVQQVVETIKEQESFELTKENFEADEELRVAAMMATIVAAGDKPISNFRVKSIKRI